MLPYLVYAGLCIFHFNYMLRDSDKSEPPRTTINIIICAQIFPFWFYQFKNEMMQIYLARFKYFLNFWNTIDSFITFSVAFIVVMSYNPFDDVIEMSDIRVVASLSSCAIMLKVFDWLRLFNKTAFYIQLIEETLRDSYHFLTLILVALLMFGVPMVILN